MLKQLFQKLLELFNDEQISKEKKDELLNSIKEPDNSNNNNPANNDDDDDSDDNSHGSEEMKSLRKEFKKVLEVNKILLQTNQELKQGLENSVDILSSLKKDREDGLKLIEQQKKEQKDREISEYIAKLKTKKVLPAQNEGLDAKIKNILENNFEEGKAILEALPDRDIDKDKETIENSKKDNLPVSGLMSIVSPQLVEKYKK